LGTCCGLPIEKLEIPFEKKYCENCKWWGVDHFPENLECRLPGNMGSRFALCGRAKFTIELVDCPDEPMTVIDGEGYSADLITRKDHYCSEWEAKE